MMNGAEQLTPAAGYIRESTKMQRKGYGADVQRQAISDYAPTVGCEVVMWREDVQQGRITTRQGYQEILAAVKQGAIHAVIVNMFDRAGRDGEEFLRFARELQRLRVPFYSVHQGQDEPGMVRYIHAGMAEEEVLKLARRVRPAKERSVRAGQHIGITPFGYKRVYPEHEGAGRYVPGLLTPDEPPASYVRELFARAAVGWSLRALALWMNNDPDCPPSPKGGEWTADGVGYILHNPAYYGHIRYNAHSVGYYDRCEKDSAFVVKGNHEPLISQELFDRVQVRLDTARRHNIKARIPGPLPLAAGLLVCAGCGGPMTPSRRADGSHAEQYVCSHRKTGVKGCQTPGYLADLAHEALLAQIARLQGCPWNPQSLDRVLEADPTADERARLQAELRDATARMERHAKRVSAMEDEMTDEELRAFRAVGKELSEAITERKEALAALPAVSISARDLAALHDEVAHVMLGDVAHAFAAAGDAIGLRALVLKLVERARVVDRVPTKRSTWLRAEVAWTRSVQLLLDAGLLTLAPDVARPDYPSDPKEARRARQLAYYHRKKARANEPAAAPPIL